MTKPKEGQVVFVHGGVAQYRGGVFYTGLEEPRWTRPIQWDVTWWHPSDRDPVEAALAPYRSDAIDGKASEELQREECLLPPSGRQCTRSPGHKGPCAAVPDDHIAWLRYRRSGERTWLQVCDSDAEGAFRVYRRRE